MGDKIYDIVLKHSGYWKEIPRTHRLKYECGRQKTIRVVFTENEVPSVVELYNEISQLLPWYAGKNLQITYTIPGSSPKQYSHVKTDEEFSGMLQLHSKRMKVEMFLSTERSYNVNRPRQERRSGRCFRRVDYTETRSKKQQDQSKQVIDVDGSQSSADDSRNDHTDRCMDPDIFGEASDESDSSYVGDFEGTETEKGHSNLLEEVIIENEEHCEDDADDCYSQDDYHPLDSSDIGSDDSNVDEYEGASWEMDEENPVMQLGRKYKCREDFRLALKQYSIKNNFEYTLLKNDTKRVVARCQMPECPWRIRAAVCRDKTTFEVRKIEANHSCTGVNKVGNRQASSKWVAERMGKEVSLNLNIPPKEIAKNLNEKYGLIVPYLRLWRGREKAREKIFGKVDENYNLVPSLREELIRRNRGSHIVYKLDTDNAFQRIFVAFHGCIQGFKDGCRPLLGLDGCHLRSKYLGVLLSATALDGNNGLFPVAFAVCEGESGETWFARRAVEMRHWFLQNLIEALGGETENLTLISDQEKGLQSAVQELLPAAEHRVCMRHLWKGFKKNFPGDFYERVVWDTARAFSVHEYDYAMMELRKESQAAYDELKRYSYTWSRSRFKTYAKNHYITNNLSESFNAWILEARSMPVVDLVDKVRVNIMEKMQLRRNLAQRWKGNLVPMADRWCRKISKKIGQWIVRRSSDFEAEVESPYERRELNLQERTCSCRRWQVTGLPCIYAAAVIGSIRNSNFSAYVDECFSVARYKAAYSYGIATLPSKDAWNKVHLPYKIGPPHTTRPRGRPKKKRMKGSDEREGNKVSKRVHKCQRCGGWGHHKNTCKNPINPRPAGKSGTSSSITIGQGRGRERSGNTTRRNQGREGRGRGRRDTPTQSGGGCPSEASTFTQTGGTYNLPDQLQASPGLGYTPQDSQVYSGLGYQTPQDQLLSSMESNAPASQPGFVIWRSDGSR